MQQKNTLTNKERLTMGGKTLYGLIWAVATAWTFSVVMTNGTTLERIVAGIALLLNGVAIFKHFKKVWDEA